MVRRSLHQCSGTACEPGSWPMKPSIQRLRRKTARKDSMTKPITIAIVGSGYVGLVAAVCFAEIGHRVVCVDNDEAKVRKLQDGKVPIHEEYLPELLTRARANGLTFTSDLRAATQSSEVIFI